MTQTIAATRSTAIDQPGRPAPRDIGARSGLIDWLRLIAIMEIVAFHVDNIRPWILFGFGLPFFLILTVAFSVGKPDAGDTGSYLRSKANRLLVPYAFWSVVYLAVFAVRCWDSHEPFFESLSPWMIVGGTAIHLWFLPVAFVSGLAAHLAQKALGGRWFVPALLVSSGIGLIVLLLASPRLEELHWPFVQWMYALPAAFFGFATGRAMSKPASERPKYLAAPLFGAVAAALIAWNFLEPVAFAAKYSLAVLVFAAGLVLTAGYDPLIRRLAPLGYGIYLTHPCCIFGLNFVERKAGITLPFAVEVAIVFLLSAVIVWLMLKSRFLSRFV